MTSTETKIIDAAVELFSRYGVKRTTMNDIAEAAGVVRQTLYLSFPSKNAVLRASIRHYTDGIIAQIENDWRTGDILSDKLAAYLKHSVVDPYRTISTAPDVEDLATGFNSEGRAEIAEANNRFTVLLAEAFQPFGKSLAESQLTPASFADFFHLTAHHLKYTARSEEHLQQLIEALRASALRLAGAS